MKVWRKCDRDAASMIEFELDLLGDGKALKGTARLRDRFCDVVVLHGKVDLECRVLIDGVEAGVVVSHEELVELLWRRLNPS